MAGYAPGCSLASASLPVNLAIEAKVPLTREQKKNLKAWRANPNLYGSQGFYVDCWVLVVTVSGVPMAPGGLYCRDAHKCCVTMWGIVKDFCWHHWKGEWKRPTKQLLSNMAL